MAPLDVVEGSRFFSQEDIAAMKLNAIAKQGAKKDSPEELARLADDTPVIKLVNLIIQQAVKD